MPNMLEVTNQDYLHFHWTGSNTNPNNNDGQGQNGSDRLLFFPCSCFGSCGHFVFC